MASERTASDGAILGHNHRTHAYADAVHVLIEAKNASGFLPPRRSSLAPPNSSTKRQRTTTTLHPSIPVPDALIASLSSTALGQFASYRLETTRHRAHRPLCSPSSLHHYSSQRPVQHSTPPDWPSPRPPHPNRRPHPNRTEHHSLGTLFPSHGRSHTAGGPSCSCPSSAGHQRARCCPC